MWAYSKDFFFFFFKHFMIQIVLYDMSHVITKKDNLILLSFTIKTYNLKLSISNSLPQDSL